MGCRADLRQIEDAERGTKLVTRLVTSYRQDGADRNHICHDQLILRSVKQNWWEHVLFMFPNLLISTRFHVYTRLDPNSLHVKRTPVLFFLPVSLTYSSRLQTDVTRRYYPGGLVSATPPPFLPPRTLILSPSSPESMPTAVHPPLYVHALFSTPITQPHGLSKKPSETQGTA